MTSSKGFIFAGGIRASSRSLKIDTGKWVEEKYLLLYTVFLLGGQFQYYSGSGSHDKNYVVPYCDLIKKFLHAHPEIIHVVDLGCGDFNVASQWINNNIEYTGIDIVDDVVRFNKEQNSSENVNFMCLDIVDDELPDGDLCIIRQVLQHLNNKDVAKVLSKCKKYKYVLITEHVTPEGKALVFNADLYTGSATRFALKSGLYFDKSPFNLKLEILQKIPDCNADIELITVLIRN